MPRDGLTTTITLYDAQRDLNNDGNPDGVDSDASDSADGISHLQYDVEAGDVYYVGIESKDRASTGRYELHIRPYDPASAPGNSGTDGPPGPLPGWGGVRGVQINLDAGGNGSSRGGIDEPAEVDWFQIDGATAGNMLVTVAGVNDDLKEFVTVFRSDGGGIDTDTGEFDGTAQVGFEVAEGERIIAAVSSHDGRYMGTYTIHVSQPGSLPDDDHPDLGETPRDLGPEITQEGDGSIRGRIENDNDNDWFRIPIRGNGFFSISVQAEDSPLVPFLELSNNGSSTGFFETDDGRDGAARISYLPGTSEVWAKVSGVDGTRGAYSLNVWRSPNPDDDHPDSGGVFLSQHDLAAHGQIFISGTIEHPDDTDNFHIRADQAGPVRVQVISQTEGFAPFFHRSRHHADPDQRTNTSGGVRASETINDVLAAPDNWIVLDVGRDEGNSPVPYGDYLIHVWQPQHVDDRDADTVGIEAWPILLDGSGNGSLPGAPNTNRPGAALDYAGDVDVFQFRAAKAAPVTISTTEPFTFLRIYDASGRAIATDHGSGPGGGSQITLEANGGDLFYVEVTAFNGNDTGAYTVQVSQAIDDHPDAPIFMPQGGQQRDATVITLDGSGFGQTVGAIEQVADRDLFQVHSPQRRQFTVEVVTTDDMLDTFLRVYDSRGNLVAIDDDGGDSRNSRATFNTFMDEDYLIEVSGYGDNSIGNYDVRVTSEPVPARLFAGVYDDFGDNNLNQDKWQQIALNGNSSLEESSGRIRLLAQGNGANNDNNNATLASRAAVEDHVEFDFTPRLGDDENFASIELTRGSERIRLQAQPDGSGGLELAISELGYVTLTNEGPIPISNDATYHVAISEVGEEIVLSIDDNTVATFVGPIRPGSVLRANVNAARLPLYDDFQDNSIDSSRWNTTGYVREEGNRLHLWMYRDGGLRYSLATTQNKPGGHNIIGFKLNSDRTAGTVGPGQAESEVSITNGSDSIIIKWLNDVNQFVLRATGYYGSGDQNRWDPDEPGPAETPDGPLEVRQHGNDIQVLHNNSVRHTFPNKTIRPGSYFRAEAYGDSGSTGTLNRDYEIMIDDLQLYTDQVRVAQLDIDNVAGNFALLDDPLLVLYDNFEDGSIDFSKWHIAGTVEEVQHDGEGRVRLPVFRNFQPVQGFISSAGTPGGTDIRGVKFTFTRTIEPKNLGTWDIVTRAELTNGTDFIRIGRLHRQTYFIETGGSYGNNFLNYSVSSDQVPDGPFEIRERGDHIEILHNNSVRMTVTNQTIRAGSYFTFRTDGNPQGLQSLPDAPETFDAFLGEVRFHVDPPPPDLRANPALAAASDTGLSDADHVTNLLSLDFEWEPAPGAAAYHWREGELQDDGTVAYGAWSATQTSTTAHVDLDGASVHVFSVRAMDSAGVVSPENARGVLIDINAPVVTDIRVRGTDWHEEIEAYSIPTDDAGAGGVVPWTTIDQIEAIFSEDMDVALEDLLVNGVSIVSYGVDDFVYDPARLTATWTLTQHLKTDKVLIQVADTGLDIAANSLDGNWPSDSGAFPSGDGDAGGHFQFRFDILQADADQNTAVNIQDGLQLRSRLFADLESDDYSLLFDFNADGVINIVDGLILRARLFSSLPDDDPPQPEAMAAFGEFAEASAMVANRMPETVAVARRAAAVDLALVASTTLPADKHTLSVAQRPTAGYLFAVRPVDFHDAANTNSDGSVKSALAENSILRPSERDPDSPIEPILESDQQWEQNVGILFTAFGKRRAGG